MNFREKKSFYYKKNRLQQLKCFYYTALLGQPTKAAEAIGVTQAAVSMQIKSLESDFGNLLFERKNKKLSLTNEGKTLYEIITPHLLAIEGVVEMFQNKKSEEKNNEIIIAANHVSISYIIPKALYQMQIENPNVKFKIKNLSWSDGLKRLLNDEVDFLIYPRQENKIPIECDFFPIATYKPILLINNDHELAKKKSLSLSEISNLNLIRIDPELITLPAFEEIIDANNLKTNIEFENGDWEILKKFVT